MEAESPENSDPKPSFRKPSHDACNRRYRKHSPISGIASSPSGSPDREVDKSSLYLKEDTSSAGDDHDKRRNDGKKTDKDFGHGNSRSGRPSEYRDSERSSYSTSRDHHRYDNHDRSSRRSVEEDRDNHRYSKSGHDARGGSHVDRSYSNRDRLRGDRYSGGRRGRDRDRERVDWEDRRNTHKDAGRYRDDERDRDRDRDRDARKGDRRERSIGEDRFERPSSHEDKCRPSGSNSGRESTMRRSKENTCSSNIGLDSESEDKAPKRKNDDKNDDRFSGEGAFKSLTEYGERDDTKKAKLPDHKNINENATGELSSLGSKQVVGSADKGILGPAHTPMTTETVHDLDAARVAAMKAAELVNRNLVGGSYMSADQKKKLLWGSKKSTVTEDQSGTHWDTAFFSEKEREKFNKLMGVKGEPVVDNKRDTDGTVILARAEKQKEVQLDLEKQYTAGLRRRDGRTVGLGL